jgi:hypothetical protein
MRPNILYCSFRDSGTMLKIKKTVQYIMIVCRYFINYFYPFFNKIMKNFTSELTDSSLMLFYQYCSLRVVAFSCSVIWYWLQCQNLPFPVFFQVKIYRNLHFIKHCLENWLFLIIMMVLNFWASHFLISYFYILLSSEIWRGNIAWKQLIFLRLRFYLLHVKASQNS